MVNILRYQLKLEIRMHKLSWPIYEYMTVYLFHVRIMSISCFCFWLINNTIHHVSKVIPWNFQELAAYVSVGQTSANAEMESAYIYATRHLLSLVFKWNRKLTLSQFLHCRSTMNLFVKPPWPWWLFSQHQTLRAQHMDTYLVLVGSFLFSRK
jgi:hypothetical protein